MSLDQISRDGNFAVLAIDHRDSLRRFLRPNDPESLTADEITELKTDIVRIASAGATGVMLEPEYSIPQLLDNGALAPGVGFLAALEAQGYLADPSAGPTQLMEGWSPKAAAQAGAAACKLLLPFHPDKPLAPSQIDVARGALAACREAAIPLILEPLFYGLEDPTDRPRVVLATARIFAAIEPDLLKLPFPVDPVVETDRGAWFDACASITEVLAMPWTVLSGGGSFEVFAEQVDIAHGAGASGFMVGRALWGEAARLEGPERIRLIEELVRPRLAELSSLIGL